MSEAEILADRIAIISDGKLICCGSSLFLKNTYNSEYCLSFILTDNQEESYYNTKK